MVQVREFALRLLLCAGRAHRGNSHPVHLSQPGRHRLRQQRLIYPPAPCTGCADYEQSDEAA